MTTFAFLFFSILVVAAIFSMAKIQRREWLDARENKRASEARIQAFRAKCFRPDGD